MLDFSAELLALRRILGQGKAYRETIFRIIATEKISATSVKELKRTIFGVLRRYFTLSYEVDSLFPTLEKDADERYLLLIALYFLRYRKDATPDEVKACYEKTFASYRLVGDAERSFEKIRAVALSPFHIPAALKNRPYTYNSMALEIPDFLLRDLVFAYGAEKAKAIALSFREMPRPSYVANPLLDEGVLSCENVSVPVSDTLSVRLLTKDNDTRNRPEILSGLFYPLDLIKVMAVSRLPAFGLSLHALLLNQRTPYLACYLQGVHKDVPDMAIVPVFEKEARYRSSIDVKCALKADKVKPLLSETELVKTYVPYDSQDLVVLSGSDVAIGKVGMRPDVLPDLTKKDMTDSSYRQTHQLVAAANFVKKNGYLLLVNAGITNEETRDVRESFLSLRKNFALVCDDVLLPTEKKTEGGYYALFRRIS